MLILTRREGETIIIGDTIKVTVTAVQGAQVKLGIQAPRDVPVHREEVWVQLNGGAINASASAIAVGLPCPTPQSAPK